MNNQKKFFIAVVVIFISFMCMNVYTYASEENKKLSQMTEDECVEFVKSQGAEIPEEYINYKELGSTIKEMIIYVESNPGAEHIYNYTATDELFTNVREVVLDYYNIKSDSFLTTSNMASVITLQYSKPLGSWNFHYETYNCYAYAISQVEDHLINPGYKAGAGYDESVISTISVERFADLVQSDLRLLGYTNISYGSTRPSYQSGYRVIALRKCSRDYHFMAEMSSNVWTHKPGSSVILQYNYSSPALGKWTNEGVTRYGIQSGSIEYTSDIMYIRYKLK